MVMWHAEAQLTRIAAVLSTICLATPALAIPTSGPSFDCIAARTPVERLICADERLSRQHTRLTVLHDARVAAVEEVEERTRLLREHRTWLNHRGRKCLDEAKAELWKKSAETCLGDAIASRIGNYRDTLTPAEMDVLKQARVLIRSDPAQAASLLEGLDSASAKLDLLLILHAFGEPGPDRDRRIRALQAELETEIEPALDNHEYEVFGPPVPYDGSDAAVIWLVVGASYTSLAKNWYEYNSIPCPILRRRPGLLDATARRFGSSRDMNLPRSGCGGGEDIEEGERKGREREAIGALWDFIYASEQADGNFLATHYGSARFGHAAHLNFQVEIARLDPWRLLVDPQTPSQRAYETWSYLSVANRRTFQTLSDLYAKAHRLLSQLYSTDFGLAEGDAARAAARGLFNAVHGADCGGAPPSISVRRLILDGAAAAEVAAFIDGGTWRDKRALEPFLTCARHAGMDPLIHLAVTRPELLDLLDRLFTAVPGHERAALDLDMQVEAANDFGKTPLMSAAQWNQLDAVEWLLARGADVNARTRIPLTEWDEPQHGERTALLYAAANASLPMIRRLLEAGADKVLTDSAGLTALDYLTGRGPVPANRTLTPAERAEAEALLR